MSQISVIKEIMKKPDSYSSCKRSEKYMSSRWLNENDPKRIKNKGLTKTLFLRRQMKKKKFGQLKSRAWKKHLESLQAKIERDGNKEFYNSVTWWDLKQYIYQIYQKKCMKCKNSSRVMHVDHIKPSSKYPHLIKSVRNMQILCEDCNLKKSNTDETDYRSELDICILEHFCRQKKKRVEFDEFNFEKPLRTYEQIQQGLKGYKNKKTITRPDNIC